MSRPEFPHEELEGLIAADALYGLSELERRSMLQEMERHGEDCAECRRLVAEYTEVAAGLALSVPPSAMSEGAEDRLLQAIGGERTAEPGRGQVRRVRRWIAAAAVAEMKVEVSTDGLRRLGPWPTPSAATTRAPTS